MLLDLLKNYGPQALFYLKQFYPEIEKLASSSVAAVRNEALRFYKEIYMWLGADMVKAYIQKLKKNQIDELEKYIAETPK